MADHAFDDQLSRFSDDIFAGRSSDAGALDDALAETIRNLKSLDHVPAPQSFRMKQIKESIMKTATLDIGSFGTVVPAAIPGSANGNSTTSPAALVPRWRAGHRWQFASIAIAVALLVLGGLGILLRESEEHPAVIPAVQETPTATDWPNFRGSPGRAGAASGGPFPAEPGVLWQTNVGARIENPAAVANGMVYVPTDGQNGLVALDAQTGSEAWHVEGIGGVPAVGDGIVIARGGTRDSTPNDLFAFNAGTGAQLWSHSQTQDAGWTPVIDQHVLYLPALPHAMQALDVKTGETIWSTELPEAVTKSVSLSDDLVVFGNADGKLYALSRDDGTIVWSTPLSGGVIGIPAIAGDRVYAPIRDGDTPGLHALELATGKELWSYSGSPADVRYAAVSGETVYLPNLDGVLTALNAADGTVKWEFQTGGPLSGSPVVSGGAVYQAGEDGQLYALGGASGQTIWTLALDGPSVVETPVVGDVIYAFTGTGSVYALSESATTVVARPAPAATPASSGSETHIWTLTGAAEPFGNVPLSAIDPQGRLWVADPHTNQIQIFDLDGTWLESWGEPGSGEGQFDFIRDNGQGIGNIAFDADGNIYVSEGGNRRIQKFDKDRNFLTSWGGDVAGDGHLFDPFSMRIAPDGKVFVWDDSAFDIRVFDADGAFLYIFGDPGDANSPAADIGWLDVAPNGDVYALKGDNSIQVFDEQGKLLRTVVPAGDGLLNVPADIVLDAAGNMYVVNIGSSEITVFDPEGNLLLRWGSFGSGDGQFNEPVQLHVRGDFVYVVEATGSRIQKFQVTLPES